VNTVRLGLSEYVEEGHRYSDQITGGMMRILHTADSHIGGGSLPSIVGALQQIGHIAVERQVDLVTFAGDAFHTRVPTPTYNRVWRDFRRHLKDHGITLIGIPGNHDRPSTKGLAHTLEPFQEDIDWPTSISWASVEAKGQTAYVVMLPWESVSDMLTQAESLGMIIEQATALAEERIIEQVASIRQGMSSPCILLAHAMMSTAEESSERHLVLGKAPVLDVNRLLDIGFDYIALGHVHKHQVFPATVEGCGPAVYCGSPRQMDFTDEGEIKGVVIVDFDDAGRFERSGFVPILTPRFHTIQVDVITGDEISGIRQRVTDKGAIKGDTVRVQLSGTAAVLSTITDDAIEQALDGLSLAYVVRRATDEQRRRTDTLDAENMTVLEALDKYMALSGVGDEQRGVYREHAERLIGGSP
jgi:exonuclease SbcD